MEIHIQKQYQQHQNLDTWIKHYSSGNNWGNNHSHRIRGTLYTAQQMQQVTLLVQQSQQEVLLQKWVQ